MTTVAYSWAAKDSRFERVWKRRKSILVLQKEEKEGRRHKTGKEHGHLHLAGTYVGGEKEIAWKRP